MCPVYSKIAFCLNGLLNLSVAIGSVKRITEIFSGYPNYAKFIDEWLGLFAIIPFGFGWLAFHLVEIFISRNKLRYAKTTLLSVMMCEIVLLLFGLFVQNGFLDNMASMSIFLILSGSFLRYSTFEDDRYLLSVKILSTNKLA